MSMEKAYRLNKVFCSPFGMGAVAVVFVMTTFAVAIPAHAVTIRPSSHPFKKFSMLKKAKSREILTQKLIDTLKAMQATSAAENPRRHAGIGSRMSNETKVNDAKDAVAENHARIEFLNSFVTALEAAGDARNDSGKILVDLAHKELLASIEYSGDSKTWLFEIYLSIAIRDIMEPSENFADFVKKFISYSSLREPRSPGDFLRDRKYLTGPPRTVKIDEDKADGTSDSKKSDP